jgi:hypothetical protein
MPNIPGSSAPVIYTDGCASFGVMNGGGIIQLELAADVSIPHSTGVKHQTLIVCHLRCSTAAARLIRDAIDRALAMPSTDATILPALPARPH